MDFKVGDIVTPKINLGEVRGVTSDGRVIVEWSYNEVDPINSEDLFLIEEKKEEVSDVAS